MRASNDPSRSDSGIEDAVREVIDRTRKLDERGQRDEAKQELLGALISFGERADLLYELGLLERYSDDHENAILHLEKAIRLDPRDGWTARIYIGLIQELSLHRHAVKFIDSISPEAKGFPALRSMLGAIYAEAGWYGLASVAFGLRRGISDRSYRFRLFYWLRSGGPIPLLRRRIIRFDEDARFSWEIWSKNLQVFDTLDYPQGFDAELIRGNVDAYIQAWVTNWAVAAVVEKLAKPLVMISAIIAGWIGVFELCRRSHSQTISSSAVSASIALVISSGIWLLVVRSGRGGSGRMWLAWRFAVYVLPGAGGIALLNIEPFSFWVSIAGYSMISGSLLAILYASTGFVLEISYAAKLEALRRSRPRQAIIDNLLDALKEVSSSNDKNDFNRRNQILRSLESAAFILERDLPKYFDSSDSQTDRWLADRAKGAATALRYLKRRILVSDESTWSWLEGVLREEISALAAGDLARLRWMSPPPKEEQIRSLQRTVVIVLRTVVVMAIPLVATFTLNPVLEMTPKIYATAKVISFGWAILYFLLTIDPTLQSKIETARNIIGTVREPRHDITATAQAEGKRQVGIP